MKCLLFSLLVILLFFEFKSNRKLINSCGRNKVKYKGEEPTDYDDCMDTDENACKLVTIKNGGEIYRYCAVIHGKYKEESVLNEVKELTGFDSITVEGSSKVLNISLFTLVLLSLFIL